MAKTNIGTAWIQVKPTTDGIKKAVEQGLNGQQLGTAVGTKFSAGFAGAVAGITSSLTKTLTSAVSQAFSGGIERADILTRFPKVMEMMGYSATDATESIQKLKDGVTGIPTSLADVVSGTQRLTGVAKDVNKASDWMLAISDAMLGVSGNTEQAALGVEQFTQVLERGVPTGQDWKTIYQTAPAIMDELAKSLGYTSGRLGGDMYTALQKGALSTDTMMDALVKLDKEGSGSMKSLQSIVRQSTGGIGTQITVIRQTVENMIATILQGGSIDGMVDSLTTSLESVAPRLIEAGAKVFLGLAKVIPRVTPSIMEAIVQMAPDLIKAFADVLVEVSKQLPELVKVIWDNIPAILDGLSQALIQLFDSGEFWQTMAIIGGIMFGPKLLGLFSGLAGTAFTKIFTSGIKTAGSSLTTTIKAIAKPLKTAVKEIMEIVKTVFKGLGEAIASFVKAFSDPMLIIGAGIFTVVAAAIAAAIFLIGKAIEAVMPAIKGLMENVVLPLGNFLKDTILALIDAMTTATIRFTNDALIPLGEFLMNSFLSYIQTMAETFIRVTNEAIIPLMTLLSGAFIQVLETVGNIITGTIGTALEGIRGIIDSVGDGFAKMGQVVRDALWGVQGILQVFADMINSIAEGLVAIVALATHQSVTYGRGYAWVTAAANGGIVTGVGTETSDSNLYALSKGEYVIRAAAAKQIGYENLDRMNRDGAGVGNTVTNNITIEGYDRDPEELANYVSRKIALTTKGVL